MPLETRKALLGHANGDITTHYSAAELNELKKAAEKIVDQRVAQTPTLTLLRVTRAAVGKVSEKRKRVGECYSLTLCFTGAPGEIRTPDRLVRSLRSQCKPLLSG